MTRALDPGWIPGTDIEWLEKLREAHERLLTELRAVNGRVHAVRRRHLDEDAEHQAAVADAAREDRDPPARPERHSPDYRAAQIAAAEAERLEVQRRLAKFIAGVVEIVDRGLDDLEAAARSAYQSSQSGSPKQRRAHEKASQVLGRFIRAVQVPESLGQDVAEQLGVPVPRVPHNVDLAAVLRLARSEITNGSRRLPAAA